jgi:hypothetical protein
VKERKKEREREKERERKKERKKERVHCSRNLLRYEIQIRLRE